ncbi:unnamed protein product, partial [Owenia fusiformis]
MDVHLPDIQSHPNSQNTIRKNESADEKGDSRPNSSKARARGVRFGFQKLPEAFDADRSSVTPRGSPTTEKDSSETPQRTPSPRLRRISMFERKTPSPLALARPKRSSVYLGVLNEGTDVFTKSTRVRRVSVSTTPEQGRRRSVW